jgi:hypothetical protein
VLGVEHLVFPFFFQGSIGAMSSDFAQGRFKACLLIGVTVRLGQFNLIDDALLLCGAAGQAWSFFGGHQWSGQHAAKGQQGER